MLEITGMLAIAVVLTGSVLVALFAGEALIKWTIAMMSGLPRANEAAGATDKNPQRPTPTVAAHLT